MTQRTQENEMKVVVLEVRDAEGKSYYSPVIDPMNAALVSQWLNREFEGSVLAINLNADEEDTERFDFIYEMLLQAGNEMLPANQLSLLEVSREAYEKMMQDFADFMEPMIVATKAASSHPLLEAPILMGELAKVAGFKTHYSFTEDGEFVRVDSETMEQIEIVIPEHPEHDEEYDEEYDEDEETPWSPHVLN